MFLALIVKSAVIKNVPNNVKVHRQFSNHTSQKKARTLGKLSLLAGLGFEDPSRISRNHINNLSIELPNDNHYPHRWNPYVAAIYEPFPRLNYNPLEYITSFAPFKWLSSLTQAEQLNNTENKYPDSGDVLIVINEAENEVKKIDDENFYKQPRKNSEFKKSVVEKVNFDSQCFHA